MKLTCNLKVLSDAFAKISGVVNPRTPKEILKSVLIQFSPEETILMGSDSEMGMRCQVPDVKCDGSGSAVLPVARIRSILSEANGDVVTLDIDDKSCEIKCGFSKFKLQSQNAADFPSIPTFTAGESFYVVSAGSLKTMVKQTVFAIDEKSQNAAMGGIQVELSDTAVILAATDGRRLALVNAAARREGSEEVSTLMPPVVPVKAMSLLANALGDGVGEVHIAATPNSICFRYGGTVITSQLLVGKFPNYKRVLVEKPNVTMDMVVSPFYSAVRQSLIVRNPESTGVKFLFGNGNLKLISRAADVGESEIEFPIQYDGDVIPFKFDPQYMAEFLKVLDPATTIQLLILDKDHQVMFIAGDYKYVVVPFEPE